MMRILLVRVLYIRLGLFRAVERGGFCGVFGVFWGLLGLFGVLGFLEPYRAL